MSAHRPPHLLPGLLAAVFAATGTAAHAEHEPARDGLQGAGASQREAAQNTPDAAPINQPAGNQPQAPAPTPAAPAEGSPLIPTPGLVNDSVSAHDQLQTEAERALTLGQARFAFRMLAERESDFAGHARLDFLLGRAANDAGEPGRAMVALERVLAGTPNNSLARAELARALFNAGDLVAAKREFSTVLSMPDVPDRARATITAFIKAIDNLQRPAPKNWTVSAEATVGHDTNANAGSGVASIFIPLYQLTCGPETACTPGAPPRSAMFAQTTVEVRAKKPFGEKNEISGSVSVGSREHDGVREANHVTLDASGGVTLRHDRQQWILTAIGQHLELRTVGRRTVLGVNFEWRHDVGDKFHAGLFAQRLALRYSPSTDRDSNRTVFGVSVGRETTHNQLSGTVAAYVGRETQSRAFDAEQQVSALRVENDLAGLRGFAVLPLNSDGFIFGSASYERRRYRDLEPLFGSRRDDRLTDFRIGVNWRLSSAVEVTPQLAVVRSTSTIPLFGLDRRQAWVTVRYRF